MIRHIAMQYTQPKIGDLVTKILGTLEGKFIGKKIARNSSALCIKGLEMLCYVNSVRTYILVTTREKR